MREIRRFPNLGHNLCENDKQTLQRLWGGALRDDAKNGCVAD